MESQGLIIEAENLTRSFKQVQAVNGLDLNIRTGEIFGLVGPDGAGKTTTLRLLAGLLDPTSGTLEVAGCKLPDQAEALKPRLGYMAQQFSLYAELTVLENLNFFADLYDVLGQERQDRIRRLLEFARLTRFKSRRAAHLSGGMQKKLALACTLIHQPQVLLLDEPTTGVDPISRREFWDILAELHLGGTTIVVSTPYMDEAERCGRVGLIYQGRFVVCDTPTAIQGRVQGELLALQPDDWQAARRHLIGLQGVLEVQTYGQTLHLVVDDARRRQPEIESALQRAGIGYYSLRPVRARMEEAFISLVRKQAN
ncbi:MAG: ABC transporter ATP-binding protein [Anaerolineales bacterium]|jgi:ABC-2 type transport system ATP-binding protein